MNNEIEKLFPDLPNPKESFNYHTLSLSIAAGAGEDIKIELECKGVDKPDCACNEVQCQIKELFAIVGPWDVIRAAGDIPLGRFSARIDWSDPEEPWVDVEP